MFADNVYAPADADNRVAELIRAMPICLDADAALTACKKEKRDPTADEVKLITEADRLRDMLVQVDVHETLGSEPSALERPALIQTAKILNKGAANFEAAVQAASA